MINIFGRVNILTLAIPNQEKDHEALLPYCVGRILSCCLFVSELWRRPDTHGRDEWRTLLAACGLDPDAADDPDPVARLRDACAGALDRYYHFDSEGARRHAAADVAAAGALLDTWTGPLPDSIELMAYWLNRARPVAAGFSAEPVEEQGIVTTNQAFREELIK